MNKYCLQKVEEIEIVMPNQHYFIIDMKKMGIVNKDEVVPVICTHFQPADVWHGFLTHILFCFLQVLLPLNNPSGNITGTLRRKQLAKLWMTHFCDLCKSEKRQHVWLQQSNILKKQQELLGINHICWENSTVYCKSLNQKVQCNVACRSLTLAHTPQYRHNLWHVESTTVKKHFDKMDINQNIKGSEL